jgi:hypothetical protein
VLEQHLLIHVYVVIRFHKRINVQLEHCLGRLVFKLYLQIGNAHLDIVYLEQLACVQLILQDIHVLMVEVW